MLERVIGYFGVSKPMLIVGGVLLLAGAALATTTVVAYRGKVEAETQLDLAQTAYEASLVQKDEAIATLELKIENSRIALEEQKASIAKLSWVNRQLKGRINALKKDNPKVADYLDTPVPPALADQLWPESGDRKPDDDNSSRDRKPPVANARTGNPRPPSLN